MFRVKGSGFRCSVLRSCVLYSAVCDLELWASILLTSVSLSCVFCFVFHFGSFQPSLSKVRLSWYRSLEIISLHYVSQRVAMPAASKPSRFPGCRASRHDSRVFSRVACSFVCGTRRLFNMPAPVSPYKGPST